MLDESFVRGVVGRGIVFRARRAVEADSTWLFLLALLLVAAAGTSLSWGAVDLTLGQLFRSLTDATQPFHLLLWEVRIPRLVASAVVGASLALSGLLMQTAVRNPLADPTLLGVTAGAGLAILLAIILLPGVPAAQPALGFLGACLGVGAVLGVSTLGDNAGGPLRIILSGVAIQAVLFSLISLVMFLFADRAPAFVAFTVGSLGSAGWGEVRLAAGPAAAGLLAALLLVRPLDALLLDEDSAASLGLRVGRIRLFLCGVAALLAAGSVVAAGMVAFVGLVVPNLVKLAVRPRHAVLLPACVMGGGTLMVLADLFARTVVAPLELPVGAVLAFVGGPTLLYLLWRKQP